MNLRKFQQLLEVFWKKVLLTWISAIVWTMKMSAKSSLAPSNQLLKGYNRHDNAIINDKKNSVQAYLFLLSYIYTATHKHCLPTDELFSF